RAKTSAKKRAGNPKRKSTGVRARTGRRRTRRDVPVAAPAHAPAPAAVADRVAEPPLAVPPSPARRRQKWPPAILLMGPTASGKTAVALRLAEQLPCEIVSVDSAQIYKGMDIGTAKPSPDLLRRAPHHLLD